MSAPDQHVRPDVRRRRLLKGAAAAPFSAAWPAVRAQTQKAPPFKRLAVAEPPFEEAYEVLIAMSPPLARGAIGRVLTQAVTKADTVLKSERLTEALDPDKTRLHEHFVLALADTLDAGDARVLRVTVDPAETEEALVAQLRERAPQADGLLLANVMGRFVALHGLAAYAPGVIVGVKARHPRQPRVWLEQIYTAGFRGIDPRASHLEVVDMPERFDDVEALLFNPERARSALVRGVEAIAGEVARRLMTGP